MRLLASVLTAKPRRWSLAVINHCHKLRRSCSPLLLAHQHGVDVAQQAGHHQAADQGQGHQVSSVMQDY